MDIVLATTSLNHGGAERHAVTLANRLAERGHRCHVAFCKDEQPSQVERLRLAEGGSTFCLQSARRFDSRALRRFASYLAHVRPGAVVAANPYPLLYASLALRLARQRAPLVATFHSTCVVDAGEWLRMLLYRGFFWSADCLVFVCENQRRHWLRRALFARRVEVIHNGVDPRFYCDRWSAAERARLRAALGFGAADYVIGISAWLRPEKNHVQLVQAAAALRARGIPARVLIIGDGATRVAIEARARALGLARQVLITGFQRDVRPFLAASDVVALCSVTETFSLAALEAMAMGRPVVHPDVGGAAEMIRPGLDGLLFPVGDTRALVGCLEALADRARAARMGECARMRVRGCFSEQAMVDRYAQLLAELGGRRRARAPALLGERKP